MLTGPWAQPHEGITGTSRDDTGDLLSLDGAAVPRRRVMIALMRQIRDAVCVGHPAPRVEAAYLRMSKPEPGDLVVAMSVLSGRRDDEATVQGMGILIVSRVEWEETDAEFAAYCAREQAVRDTWNAEHPGHPDTTPVVDERLTDRAWYVQYGPAPGDVCRWVNDDFYAMPGGPGWAADVERLTDDVMARVHRA